MTRSLTDRASPAGLYVRLHQLWTLRSRRRAQGRLRARAFPSAFNASAGANSTGSSNDSHPPQDRWSHSLFFDSKIGLQKFMNLESQPPFFTNRPIGGTNTLKHPLHGRAE